LQKGSKKTYIEVDEDLNVYLFEKGQLKFFQNGFADMKKIAGLCGEKVYITLPAQFSYIFIKDYEGVLDFYEENRKSEFCTEHFYIGVHKNSKYYIVSLLQKDILLNLKQIFKVSLKKVTLNPVSAFNCCTHNFRCYIEEKFTNFLLIPLLFIRIPNLEHNIKLFAEYLSSLKTSDDILEVTFNKTDESFIDILQKYFRLKLKCDNLDKKLPLHPLKGLIYCED